MAMIVTVVFLALVLWGIDVEHALAALREVSWWMLLPMCALYLCAHMLRVWRLKLLLNQPIRYWRLFSINSVGFLAINVIPLRLGEMVRPYLLAERENIPFGRGMAAIVLERLLDMLMLLGMLMGLTLMVELPEGGLVIDGIDVISAGQRFAGTIVARCGLGVFLQLFANVSKLGLFGLHFGLHRENLVDVALGALKCLTLLGPQPQGRSP